MTRLSGWLPTLLAATALFAGAGQCAAQVVLAPPPPAVVTVYRPAVVVTPAATVTTYRYGVLPRRRVTVTTYYGAAPVVPAPPVVRVPRRVYYAPVYVGP
jgi:hypothetical protein